MNSIALFEKSMDLHDSGLKGRKKIPHPRKAANKMNKFQTAAFLQIDFE